MEYSQLNKHGPRRAETLPVRFNDRSIPSHLRSPRETPRMDHNEVDIEPHTQIPIGQPSFQRRDYLNQQSPYEVRHDSHLGYLPESAIPSYPTYGRDSLSRADRIYRDAYPLPPFPPPPSEPPLSYLPRPIVIERPRLTIRHRAQDDSESNLYSEDYGNRSRSRTRQRSQSRRRRRRSRSYGSRSVSSSSVVTIEHFDSTSFSLSRHKRSDILGSSSGKDSLLENSASVRQPPVSGDAKLPKAQSVSQSVLHCQYTGDGLVGGVHSAQLTVIPNEAVFARPHYDSLFDWIQIPDSSMDFDNFQNEILCAQGLRDPERNGIYKFLERVKKNYEITSQAPQGVRVKYMIPRYDRHSLNIDTPSNISKTKKLQWLCLPYFSLQKNSEGTKSANTQTSAHPLRTLMQAHRAITEDVRDSKQAVCHLPNTPANFYFHIGQIWFLIVEDSFMVSCAGLSPTQLYNDTISIARSRYHGYRPPVSTLLVSAAESSLWSFPLAECKTWLSFVSHFLEFWPQRYEFSLNGDVITSKDWPRVYHLAEKSSIRLDARFLPLFKKPSTGILIASNVIHTHSHTHNGTPAPQMPETGSNTSTQPDIDTSFDDENLEAPADATGSSSTHGKTLLETDPLDDFHLFTWLNIYNKMPAEHQDSLSRPVSTDWKTSKIAIQADLQEIDDFLRQKINLNERLTYQSVPHHTRKEFYSLIVRDEAKLKTSDESFRKDYEMKVDLANAAELLFRCFLPPDFQGPTVASYWGAFHSIVLTISPSELDDDAVFEYRSKIPGRYRSRRTTRPIKRFIDRLETVARRTEAFRELLSIVPLSQREKVQLSEKFPRAWLHLLLSIAFMKDPSSFNENIDLCFELLTEGMHEAIQSLSEHRLSDYVVCTPFDLVSLITLQLSQDLTGQLPDICETYMQYITILEDEIGAKPLDRRHQERIILLKQEVSVILGTLKEQRLVLWDAQKSQATARYHEGARERNRTVEATRNVKSTSREHATHYRDAYPMPNVGHYTKQEDYYGDSYEIENQINFSAESNRNNPHGLQGLLFQESLALIDERIRIFQDIDDRANYLQTLNLQRIDTNKDRQESAVYAFTIITIIFLPLSTVASILGMNTNDVRNMEFTQWLYWSVALPLTGIIITLCLIWTGELRNLWEGFSGLWRSKTKMRGYVPNVEEYVVNIPGAGKIERMENEYTSGYSRGPLPRMRTTLYGNAWRYD